jgi:hypothetical protein
MLALDPWKRLRSDYRKSERLEKPLKPPLDKLEKLFSSICHGQELLSLEYWNISNDGTCSLNCDLLGGVHA